MIDKPCFILPSVSDRLEQLNNILITLHNSPYYDWDIVVYYQDYLNNAKEVVSQYCTHFINVPERVGVVNARLNVLNLFPSYRYYGHIDDDMQLLPQTNYFPIIEFLNTNPQAGHVMSAWVRYEGAVEAGIGRIRNEYTKQILFYTGGGQFYKNDVAQLYINKHFVIGRRDNETIWTLLAYLNGFENYVYRGSLALHRILQKGGNQSYRKDYDKKDYVGFPSFIDYKILKDGSFSIPLDKDVKKNAKNIHKNKYNERFGDCKIFVPNVQLNLGGSNTIPKD